VVPEAHEERRGPLATRTACGSFQMGWRMYRMVASNSLESEAASLSGHPLSRSIGRPTDIGFLHAARILNAAHGSERLPPR
jgi:hypothetical protein